MLLLKTEWALLIILRYLLPLAEIELTKPYFSPTPNIEEYLIFPCLLRININQFVDPPDCVNVDIAFVVVGQ